METKTEILDISGTHHSKLQCAKHERKIDLKIFEPDQNFKKTETEGKIILLFHNERKWR